MNEESLSRYLGLEEFCIFFLVPSVFSLNNHLVISHQKEGRAAACPEARSIMIFLPCLCTGSSEWVASYLLAKDLWGCTPPSSCIRAPSAPCTALQSRCLGADFQKDWAKPVSSSSLPMTAFFYNYAGSVQS